MRSALVFFALGCAALQWQASLPPLWLAIVLVFLGLGLLAGIGWFERARLPVICCAALCIGIGWSAGLAHWRLQDGLPTEWEGRDIEITGVIASLPQPFERGVRFEFETETRLTPGAVVPARLLLSWYGGFGAGEVRDVGAVHAGERWRLTVRLRKPHGNANPHGFDYEAWLLERGIRATGYVRPARGNAAGNTLLTPFVWSVGTAINRTREVIRTRLLAAMDGAPYAGVIVALAVGDQRAIDSTDWELFTRTGVGHLMSISGLHVTMIASLAAWCVLVLWRRSTRLMLWLPAPKAAAAAGALAALLYCLLAGWGVPAQRTLYMIGVAAWALWRGWFGSGSRVLAIALGIVCLLDPWAPLAAGFWLSFGAVALLLLTGNTQRPQTHWASTALKAQIAITLGLTPLTIALFGQVSLAGPLANAVAIPVVSFIVTPLALAAAVLPFEPVAMLAHWVMACLMNYLDWLNEFEWAVWQRAAPPLWAVLLAIAGAVWCLIPSPWAWRVQGLAWMTPLVFLPAPQPAPGELWLTVLDVGQGLSIVARTQGHTLLYDAGPRYSPDADSGNRVVVPYLRGEGVNRLDTMMITHDDIDHFGGAESVVRAVPTELMSTSLNAEHPARRAAANARDCMAGQQWQWEGVTFEVLHPRPSDYEAGAGKRDNAMSCVLRVSAHGRSVLLSADIEADVERLLVAEGAPLKSDVLVAPHHGSKTSSTAAFLAAVRPDTIIIPVGYRNRFRHPAPDVLARYESSGAKVLRTDAAGAVTLRVSKSGIDTEAFRSRNARYWHAR